MMPPAFPMICVSEDLTLDLIPAEASLSRVATSALIDPGSVTDALFFDGNGNKWTEKRVADKFKNTFFTRLLAKTFYNPMLEAKVIWTHAGTYTLNELKDGINACIDADDDIITQFEEGDVIKMAVGTAEHFDEVVKVLKKYVFEVNEEALWKENGREAMK